MFYNNFLIISKAFLPSTLPLNFFIKSPIIAPGDNLGFFFMSSLIVSSNSISETLLNYSKNL